MRQSPIVRALVNPKMSEGMSTTATGLIYGIAVLGAIFAFQAKPWAAVLPFVGAVIVHAWVRHLFKKDMYFFKIYNSYSATADHYQPWSAETLRGRGARPRGFGRGFRC
ncbi:VirB3 family type IV secretion system protein [Paraburkholderia youngii]|uniref:VirB3 family type IV secretion system protein n=1 Tax=Paraburkholderia youngii TaxID=2782701 RepID=UPI003D253BD9